MSKFESSLKEYAKQLGVEELYEGILGTPTPGVGAAGAGGITDEDIEKLVLKDPDYIKKAQEVQNLATQLSDAGHPGANATELNMKAQELAQIRQQALERISAKLTTPGAPTPTVPTTPNRTTNAVNISNPIPTRNTIPRQTTNM
jgi:hypothetical protein